MARYIFTMLLCLIGAEAIHAQRFIKGKVGFEAVIGAVSDRRPVDDHIFIQAGLTVNGMNGNYKFWNLEYAQNVYGFESYHIPVETFSSEAGYSLPLLSDWRKNISLNGGIGFMLGYEVFNRSQPLLSNGAVIQNADSFIYGGSLRLNLETYVTDHVVFVIQGKVKGVWGTSIENFRPSAGIGVRYIF